MHPSICLLRWLRLLFVREFSLEGVFYLWDRVLVHPLPNYPVLEYVATAILLLLETPIRQCESIQQLMTLLQDGCHSLNVRTVWELALCLWRTKEATAYEAVVVASEKKPEEKKEKAFSLRRLFHPPRRVLKGRRLLRRKGRRKRKRSRLTAMCASTATNPDTRRESAHCFTRN